MPQTIFPETLEETQISRSVVELVAQQTEISETKNKKIILKARLEPKSKCAFCLFVTTI